MTVEFFHSGTGKAHMVAADVGGGEVRTECGLTFHGVEHTSVMDPQKPVYERTVTAPGAGERCGNCPWDRALGLDE